MNDTVVIDGEINLLSMIDGDLSVAIPADSMKFETGLWTPTGTYPSMSAYVPFSLPHTEAPIYAAICDTSDVLPTEEDGQIMKVTSMLNISGMFGIDIQNGLNGNMVKVIAQDILQRPPSYWAEERYTFPSASVFSPERVTFMAHGGFMPGRTYRWIAVWR